MRGTEYLHPYMKNKAEQLVVKCKEKGLIIQITDTKRNKGEQDKLYAQGRTEAGNIVTNCKYPNSYHNWGLAFDFCRADGKGAYNDTDNFFRKVGAVGRELGLVWGGDFKSIKDKPHFETHKYGVLKELKSKWGLPENMNTHDSYGVTRLHKGSRGRDVKLLQAFLDVNVDGIFGSDTDTAVRNFQSVNGLVVDGWVGEKTWEKIRQYITMETK